MDHWAGSRHLQSIPEDTQLNITKVSNMCCSWLLLSLVVVGVVVFLFCSNVHPPKGSFSTTLKIDAFSMTLRTSLPTRRLSLRRWNWFLGMSLISKREYPEIRLWVLKVGGLMFWSGLVFSLLLPDQVPSVQCLTDKTKCPRKPTVDHATTKTGVDGPPCILFSQTLGFESSITFCAVWNIWLKWG